MTNSTDIVIVGGGLVGPLAAIALSSAGFRSTVIDALPLPKRKARDFDGRAYSLSHSSVSMLRVLGLWDDLEANAQPILDIKVSDGRAGEGASPLFLHFDHRELEEGPFGYLVEDRHLRACLLDRLKADAQIGHLSGVDVMDVAPGKVSTNARRKADRCIEGAVVLGCDGRNSIVAAKSGIDRMTWSYQQASLVCAVEHELPHDGIAHQFFAPSGPLAILPLKGNRSSIVWTETRDRAEELMSEDADFLAALRPVFGDFLGDIRLVGRRYQYPLGLSLAQNLVGDRVALVGDAAHGIHPLAGQGFNLGMRDVAALTETLSDALRRGEDPGAADVLARYQSWRRFDTAAMAMFTDGVNRVFSNDVPVLRAVRDLGLGLVGAVPQLRRTFMREAMGLSGDMPRLLRGLSV